MNELTNLHPNTTALIFAFLFCFTLIRLVKPLAIRFGLIDQPGGRKTHNAATPLIGGLAIFLSVLTTVLLFGPENDTLNIYLLSTFLMLCVGVLDDRYDLKVFYRLIVQFLSASLMVFVAGKYLHSFGNLLGIGEVTLGWFGPIITIVAVMTAINAFNMVDGIDGLAGMLSIVSLSALAILMNLGGNAWFMLPLLFIVAIMAYLVFNLDLIKGRFKKIFMGDAGSMAIGLTIVWLLVLGSQGEQAAFNPVTALWIIAVPLMDMSAIMYRRVKKGQSPFRADRNHLHHIFMRAGLTSRQTLLVITSVAILYAAIGIVGDLMGVPEVIMLGLFLALFAIYAWGILHIWKVITWFHKKTGKI
jgi:UDP-GlcNAc:undecaprenyl-phosphate GlcNAc-1-phosphate transferase